MITTHRFLLILCAYLFAGAASRGADANPQPAAASVVFAQARISGNEVAAPAGVDWISGIRQQGGYFDAQAGAWVASTNLAKGQGSLIIGLNRGELPADLALTLVYDELPGSDFVVQLWDDQDRIVALDLFSNIITAGQEARTDTFIIPFADHPAASRIVLRRISGTVRIYGFVLYPVACEVPVTVCDEKELAIQLGGKMSPENPLVQEANRIAAALEKLLEWETREIKSPVNLAEVNAIGDQALGQDGYPAFVPAPAPVAGQGLIASTGSALFFMSDAARKLNLYHAGALLEVPGLLTSQDAKNLFFEGASPICVMSVPMSVADREQFYRKHGYHVLETQVALDAIQVVVNESNPLQSVTIPQLDAIYGVELRAGWEKQIRTWGDLGAGGEWAELPVEVWGGSQGSGTFAEFQRVILQGGPFREDILQDNQRYYYGLVAVTATNKGAIGYSNLQHHVPGARQLALARNAGQPAYQPAIDTMYNGLYPLTRYLNLYINARTAKEIDPLTREFLSLLFSREGQTIVAENKQIPLSPEQVLKARAALEL